MNFKPFGDRVLVERQEESNTTATGIIIPDNAKEKPLQAKVVAVGNEIEEDTVNVNDTIVFTKYSGTELSIEGKDYLVLDMSDILGKLK